MKYGSDSARYSFKIIFGKFTDGQTFQGLDRLNLNSCFADASYLKEYLAYELFRKMDVPSPLCSFVSVKINGKNHGFYMTMEEEDPNYLNRIAMGGGTLYKPEFDEPPLDEERVRAIISGVPMQVHDVKGSDLVYVDDNPETYPDIFENVVTESNPESEERVIRALKAMKEGTDLDSVLDTDEIIRYFAVHNFLMNYDSYTGMMLHNYHLYDYDGKIQILPWDYNLGFGSFPLDSSFDHENDSTLVVNKGIDTPLVSTDPESRPLWKWIVSDNAYLEQYHKEMDKLIKEQFESGKIINELDRIHQLIVPYIEKDATAFYTPAEAEKGFEVLKELRLLRAESIRRQLNGRLPADTDEQNSEDRVDASKISLNDLNSFGF